MRRSPSLTIAQLQHQLFELLVCLERYVRLFVCALSELKASLSSDCDATKCMQPPPLRPPPPPCPPSPARSLAH
eukprot:2820223-Pyramimonas_sp.AAC.2